MEEPFVRAIACYGKYSGNNLILTIFQREPHRYDQHEGAYGHTYRQRPTPAPGHGVGLSSLLPDNHSMTSRLDRVIDKASLVKDIRETFSLDHMD